MSAYFDEMNASAFASAAELRQACQSIPRDAIDAYKGGLIASLHAKGDAMPNLSAGNATLIRNVSKYISGIDGDNVARVCLAHGIPSNVYLRKIRGKGGERDETFNLYGVWKHVVVAPLCLSASPLWEHASRQSDMNTTFAVARAFATGNFRGEKDIANAVNDYMHSIGKATYNSGSTQGSSSAHALAALGLIVARGVGDFAINGTHALQMLRQMTGVEAMGDASPDASDGMPGASGIVIDGECSEVREAPSAASLALPSPHASTGGMLVPYGMKR